MTDGEHERVNLFRAAEYLLGGRNRHVEQSQMPFPAIIGMYADHLEGYAVDGDEFSDGRFFLEQLVADLRSDGDHLSGAGRRPSRLMSRPSTRMVFSRDAMVRMVGDDIEGTIFIFVADQIIIPQIIAGGNVFDFLQMSF